MTDVERELYREIAILKRRVDNLRQAAAGAAGRTDSRATRAELRAALLRDTQIGLERYAPREEM